MKKSARRILICFAVVAALITTAVFADTFVFRTSGENDEKSELAEKIEMLMEVIKKDYYKEVDEEELINGAIKGMFDVLDPHSTYFTEEEFNEFMIDLSGEITGVGIQIERREDGITVVAPIKGTPAYKAGIKTGDKIVSVDGIDITDYTADKAASLIRGKEGTEVKLGIRREGYAELIYYELVREKIEINPVEYKIKEDNIGYLRITEFNENTSKHVAEAVNAFKEKQVKGVIIDLRGNPGGLLDEVIKVCRLFIPKGPIVKIQMKDEIVQEYVSDLEKAPFKLVVLVNGGSASASEIMAGAVKDSKTGILVGEKTYGKGTVQKTMKIQGGGGAKLTIANYLTPSGFSLDGIGITPDIEVKSNVSNAGKYTAISGERSLKKRVIGLDVLGLQERLKALGYDPVKLDGVFGPMTEKAVLAFQKDNNLPLDASMDPDDIKVLQKKIDESLNNTDPQLDRAMEEIKKLLQSEK